MTNPKEVEILLVEDNIQDAELTIHALKKHNLSNRLVWVKDGIEALNLVLGKENNDIPHPKVILLDLKLPKMDGIEVLRQLKSDERTKYIPVVILTSSSEQPDIAECYKLGVNSYIVKPVKFEKFFEAVANMGMYWLLLNQMPKQL